MSGGIHGRIHGECERRVCGQDVFCALLAAVAKLVAELLLGAFAPILLFNRIQETVESRNGHGKLGHPDHSSDLFDSFLLGELLVQRPGFGRDPHLARHVVPYRRLDQKLSDPLGSKNHDHVNLLGVDLLKCWQKITVVQIVGVCQADLGVLYPLHEHFLPVGAVIVPAVKEGNPVPLKVLQNVHNHQGHFFIRVHCSQERGKLGIFREDGTGRSVRDLWRSRKKNQKTQQLFKRKWQLEVEET